MDKVTTDFVRHINKLYERVSHILTELKSIGKDVKSIHENHSATHEQTPSPETQPPNSSVPSSAKTYKSYDAKQYALDKLRFSLEKKAFCIGKWTAGILGIYTIFTILMYFANKTSAEAAKKAATTAEQALTDARIHFIAEQRPILWITNQLGTPAMYKNPKDPSRGQIVWDWHFTNYGKTPPEGVHFRQFFKLGDEAPVPSYDPDNLVGASGNIGAPTPPGKDDFDTVISAPMQRKAATDLITQGKVTMIVVMKYGDLSGSSYETGICLNRTNAGSITYCKEGNYIK